MVRVRQGYGWCQNSPGVYNTRKKILVASRPTGSPPKTRSSVLVPAHGGTKPVCTEVQQTCPPLPLVFIQLCAMRICILKDRSCSWSELGLQKRGERARGQEISVLFRDIEMSFSCESPAQKTLQVASYPVPYGFFSCWYIAASTICALLMVFKAIDMRQLSCFTVNHREVIT